MPHFSPHQGGALYLCPQPPIMQCFFFTNNASHTQTRYVCRVSSVVMHITGTGVLCAVRGGRPACQVFTVQTKGSSSARRLVVWHTHAGHTVDSQCSTFSVKCTPSLAGTKPSFILWCKNARHVPLSLDLLLPITKRAVHGSDWSAVVVRVTTST